MEPSGGYRLLFQERSFMRNSIANMINRIGDSIDMIAYSWLIYQITGSAGWSALMLGVNMLPTVCIQPFAGALVESLPKKKLIVFCDLSRGVLTCLIAILFLMGNLQPWTMLLMTFLNNTFEAFRSPANIALLPAILSKENYEFGSSFTQTSSRLCELLGSGIAGVVIAFGGIATAIFIDALSFFLCALLMAGIRVKETYKKRVLSFSEYGHSLKEGFQYIKTMPILLLLCFIALLLNAILVPFNSFLTPYIRSVLQQDAQLLSYCSISLSCALMLGAFLYPYLHKRICNRNLFLAGLLLTSIFYLCAYGIHDISNTWLIYGFLGIACILFGFGIALLNSIASVAVLNKVDRAYLARFSSVFSAIATAAMPITSFLLGALTNIIPVVNMFLYAAIFTIVIFIVMLFIKLLREL